MDRITDIKRNKGFLLLELCLAVSILLTLVGLTVIPPGSPAEKMHLEALTREMAWDLAAVRQHAVGNNGSGPIWKLSVRQQEYVVLAGTRIIKRRSYEKDVKLCSTAYRKDFYFDEQGRPKGNQMKIVLQGRCGYEKKIVIAAQTGRIRMV